jgi:hemolysin III
MISVWLLTLFGIYLDVNYDETNVIAKRIGLLIYLVEGWFVLLISSWLFPLLSSYTILMLGLGGVAYTGGVYFYIKGETQVRYHVLWHMFVLLGALLHYFSVKEMLFGEHGVHTKCDS